jgi:hypothetical protein
MAPRPASSSPPPVRLPAGREESGSGGPRGTATNVLDLLQPGSFVRLRNQPEDLPPFELIRCRGGRCWVRQQAWGSAVQWEVAHRQLTTAA